MKKLRWQIKRNHLVLGAIIAMLLMIGGTGVTYAYNQHNTRLDNLLKASSVAGEIIENGSTVGEDNQLVLTPNGETEKRVCFKNIGEADTFVRVTFSEAWIGSGGEWLINNAAYTTLNWSDEWKQEWQLKDDGWYYYKKILPSKATTKEVLSSVGFASFDELPPEYRRGTYQLFFTMEVLQYSEEEAVNVEALEKAFGRTATVTKGEVAWN